MDSQHGAVMHRGQPIRDLIIATSRAMADHARNAIARTGRAPENAIVIHGEIERLDHHMSTDAYWVLWGDVPLKVLLSAGTPYRYHELTEDDRGGFSENLICEYDTDPVASAMPGDEPRLALAKRLPDTPAQRQDTTT